MRKVIDVRDTHTAIHSYYIVNRKPKTALKLFAALEKEIDLSQPEYEAIWREIGELTTDAGEYNANTQMQGRRVWKNSKELQPGCTLTDNGETFSVIGSFDLW